MHGTTKKFTRFFDVDTEADDIEALQDFDSYGEALAYAKKKIDEGLADSFVIEEAS